MIEIVHAKRERYGDIVRVWNEVWPEFPTSEEELLHSDQSDEELRSQYWLASDSTDLLGLVEIGPISGSHDPRTFSIRVAVLDGAANKGVGSNLYNFAISQIGPKDPTSILSWVREEDEKALKFAVDRGFLEAKRDFQSVLDLQSLNAEMLAGLIAIDLLDGIRVVSGAELDSVQFRHAFHELFEEVRKDTPRTFPPTALTFEQFQHDFIGSEFQWAGSMFAMRGEEPVGFCVVYHGTTPGRLDQGLTAIDRGFRGRGIATALKAHAMRWAIGAGYEHVRTDNDSRNMAMLAINKRFGFRDLPASIQMLWSRNGDG